MNFLVRYLLSVGLLASSLGAFATPPTITLIYPPQSAAFSAPATIPLVVSASDPDGGSVVKVEYFLGGGLLGEVTTAPFSASLTVPAGTYTFSARATDSQGEVAISNTATVTVYSAVTGNTAPTVEVSLPLNGSAYSLNAGPVVAPILVNAADAGGSVNRVELFVNGIYLGWVSGGVMNTGLGFSIPGAYSIVARAYDNLGISTTSTATTINIYAAAEGNAGPTASLASPGSGDTYLPSATIPISATAGDSDGSINRVEFILNNSLKNVMTAEPYSFGLAGVASGSYTLRARAYDNLGVYTDSSIIPFVVNTPPTVNITAPANNTIILATASFTLQANATDADGNLSKVEFYQGETLLGEDTTSPYSWPLSNLPWGNYAYKAKAYDALGAVVTSTVKNVVVNEPPTIALAATGAFSGFNAPADIVLTASPRDVDGTISRVEFYSDSQLVGTYTASPYSHTVVGATAGTYTFTARAYDNRSATATSNDVPITVSPAATPATFSYDELGRLVGAQH